MKPFKPPRPVGENVAVLNNAAKKIGVAPQLSIVPTTSVAPTLAPTSSITPLYVAKKISVAPQISIVPTTSVTPRYYAVFTAKVSSKVHKVYDSGFLKLDGRTATLFDGGGKFVAKEANVKFVEFSRGQSLRIGSNETECEVEISAADFLSGKAFLDGASLLPAPPPRPSFPPTSTLAPPTSSFAPPTSSFVHNSATRAIPRLINHSSASNPISRTSTTSGPRYDPTAEGALVLQEATDSTVAVVCDPFLSRKLRPHQKEGVQFLWRCIAGTKNTRGSGGILADDMGLGKTLQTIALIWTALKQSPASGTRPLVSKCVIVTPATLVENWRQEFSKWLGNERCRPLALTQLGKEAEEAITVFSNGSEAVQSVLILSYEMLRKNVSFLTDSPSASKIGLLICDEGHRLKNIAGSKTLSALAALPTARRIILTGTPLQNNLEELFALTNFVRRNALGDLSTFRAVFEGPISAGRDSRATDAEIELCNERSAELARRMESFVLRRMAESIAHSLPSKTETLIFCRLSPLQVNLYKRLSFEFSSKLAAEDAGQVLVMLGILRKICAHPDLVHMKTVVEGTSQKRKTSCETVTLFNDVDVEDNEEEAEEGEGSILADDDDSSISIYDILSEVKHKEKKSLKRPRQESNSCETRSLGPSGALFNLLESTFPPDYNFGVLTNKVISSSSQTLSTEEKASLSNSSKLTVLCSLLAEIRRAEPTDRVVIVSLFASVLNLVEALCQSLGYPVLRLDGSTPVVDRQRLVTRFNDPKTPAFIFLLSSKAGGAGINLIGANRLIAMDCDWNPATDAQALARIWRDGQMKPCFIYRLISAFTVEEKILQRQMSKNDLAAAVSGKNTSSTPRLSRAELLDLFSMDPETGVRGSHLPSKVGGGGGGGGARSFGYDCDTARMFGSSWRIFNGTCSDDAILDKVSRQSRNNNGEALIVFVKTERIHEKEIEKKGLI
jgi:SNF2 family DNA or RNA helicase